jgi:hypothetical protein
MFVQRPSDEQYHENFRTGIEVVSVFIASETCFASNKPGFAPLIVRMNDSLRARARREHKQFATIGVSVGWSTEKGLEYLKKFGPFDELSVGHNWLNLTSLSFMRDPSILAVIPYLVVLERPVKATKEEFSVGPDRVLLRAAGVREIERWVNSGMRY